MKTKLSPNGVFATLAAGGLFIDHTTVSARIARQIAVEARDKHIHCVDAPMTGAQPGAEAGTLTLMDFHLAFWMMGALGVLAVVDCFTLPREAGAEVSGHRTAA